MSLWSVAPLVKGAFCSTTANRGGIKDCRAERNTCNLCSSRLCSPCYRKGDIKIVGNRSEKWWKMVSYSIRLVYVQDTFLLNREVLAISSFSIRANKEGMSAVCKVPSSVVQAAKAGIKTWWTALTTRSDGSPRESSMSSKPCREHTYVHRKAVVISSIKQNYILTYINLQTHIPGSIYQGRLYNPW